MLAYILISLIMLSDRVILKAASLSVFHLNSQSAISCLHCVAGSDTVIEKWNYNYLTSCITILLEIGW